MRVSTLLFVGVITAIGGTNVLTAQSKPDFSGTWTFDPERSTKTQPGMTMSSANPTPTLTSVPLSPVFGTEVTIRQDQKTLTVWRTVTPTTGPMMNINGSRADEHVPIKPVTYKLEYALDGSETRNVIPAPYLVSSVPETASTLAWNDATLVITVRQTAGRGATPSVPRALHLDADGALVIDVTGPGLGGTPSQTTHVYKRMSAATTPGALTIGANLSGTWTLNSGKTPADQATISQLEISQDTTTFTIRGTDRSPSGTSYTFETRFALDGSSSRNKVPAIAPNQPDIESVSVVNWDQQALVLTRFWSSQPYGNAQYVFHLEPDGSLVLDELGAAQGRAPLKAHFVYKKK